MKKNSDGYIASMIVQAISDSKAKAEVAADMIVAADRGELKNVERLLAEGADVHHQNDYALRSACNLGYVDIARRLIDAGANIHACNDYAFFMACSNGHVKIVDMLLKTKEPICQAAISAGVNNAIVFRRIGVVNLLLDAGVMSAKCLKGYWKHLTGQIQPRYLFEKSNDEIKRTFRAAIVAKELKG